MGDRGVESPTLRLVSQSAGRKYASSFSIMSKLSGRAQGVKSQGECSDSDKHACSKEPLCRTKLCNSAAAQCCDLAQRP